MATCRGQRWMLCFLLAGSMASCHRDPAQENPSDVLISVKKEQLTRKEFLRAMPQGLSPQDSVRFAERYLKQWAGEVLLYHKAKENLPEMDEIDQLVNKYRRDLVLFEYRKQLVSDKVSADASEEELKKYYEVHKDLFRLNVPILRGLFLKVSDSAPQLNQLKNWCNSGNESAVENIEKYGLKNALIYEYFKDKWILFDEVINNVPYEVKDEADFLRSRKYLEVNKDGYCYFLHIYQYMLPGETMPFEFAKERIKEITFNERRMAFTQMLEEDLYKEGIKEGTIVLSQDTKEKK